jgi:hypothetical protein
MPPIVALAHPVDVDTHPTYPPGFRWAVHVGEDFADMSSCLNAGWEPTLLAARMAGEAAAVCAHKVAARFDPSVGYLPVVLDVDPVPAEADDLPLISTED